ncbi:uncharacterized protein RAG0_08379 [Rhynchosporium agropyri]|uniref:Rrn9 domain-containing protein n=1 Tax=Rhynchosporium agropyri TaxID=914238 RepID=A0A1E1KQM1_9HELO|nr:uncharacterized protein RAG0_08379 [Rhynchosporium agropyri]
MSNSNDTSSDSESVDETTRPNRWTGPPSSWLLLTEEERGLAASLDTLRNADLSIHLFNAHALKRHAREVDGGVNLETEFPGVPPEDRTFRPAKGWTAWPLSPEDVPRTGEEIGPRKSFEEYTYRANEDGAPSRELEDVLMGVTLKFAKERFMARQEAPPQKDYREEGKSKGKDKAKHTIEEDLDDTGSEYHNSSDEGSVDEEEQVTRSDEAKSYLKPVVSADDEHSRQLLLPSVRHTLSKLDDILIALHHARKTCHRYSHSEAETTDDEFVADTNFSEQGRTSPEKRTRGRPRKFANIPSRAKARLDHEPDPEIDDGGAGGVLSKKSPHAGRPKKTYYHLEGETEQDYLIRVARLQKKLIPSFAPAASPPPTKSPSRGRSRSRSLPARRATSEELRDRRKKKLALRDWSEVLGTAALVGVFDKEVVERATRRCADLFGEGMILRGMNEVPIGEKGQDEIVRYVPDLVPAIDSHILGTSSSESQDSDTDSNSESKSEGEAKVKPGLRTTSHISRQAVFCPIPACPRRIQGFRDVRAMKRHLERGHGIARDDVGEWIVPSDEDMEGAVHRDGFLRPVKKVRVSRGSYGMPAKKAKKRNEKETEDSGDWEDDGLEDAQESGGRDAADDSDLGGEEEGEEDGTESDDISSG